MNPFNNKFIKWAVNLFFKDPEKQVWASRFIVIVVVIIALACVCVWAKGTLSGAALADKERGENSDRQENKTEELLGATDCIASEWKEVVQEDWFQYTWFLISNGVWTIGSKENDAAIYHNIGCVGGSLVEYSVVPRLENYLNINIYQRGQLRWEIGGGDRRSIRLWKNVEGCATEVKGAKLILEKYLSDHDSILIDQELVIHSALFYLPNGKIRSEIWLTYSSEKNNGKVITTPREEFFYDFEPGSVCDKDHFPDINKEPYQPGIGLQKSQITPDILPKVEFNRYRISRFSSKD